MPLSELFQYPLFFIGRANVTALGFLQAVVTNRYGHKPESFRLLKWHVTKPLPFSPTLKRVPVPLGALITADIDHSPEVRIFAVIGHYFGQSSLFHNDASNS